MNRNTNVLNISVDVQQMTPTSVSEKIINRHNKTIENIETKDEKKFTQEYNDYGLLDWSKSELVKQQSQNIIESSRRYLELILESEKNRNDDGVNKTQTNSHEDAVSSVGVASAYVLRKYNDNNK